MNISNQQAPLAIVAGLLLVSALFVGIDMEPVLSDHEVTSVPVPFIKKRPSLSFIFSLPIEPYWIIYKDPNIPPEKRQALQTYCGIRFGEGEKECLETLEDRLRESGFYKPE